MLYKFTMLDFKLAELWILQIFYSLRLTNFYFFQKKMQRKQQPSSFDHLHGISK